MFHEEKDILWVQFDLCAIDQHLINLVLKQTGLKEDQLLFSATHTHSAPGGTLSTHQGMLKGMESVFCDFDPDFCQKIADQLTEAYHECKENLQDSTMRLIQGKIDGLGTERHDPSLPCDDDLFVLELTSGSKKAMIVRAACHPTVLNGDNIEISADFPGTVESHFEDYELVAYVNGSCGDMSTRFTRKGQGFEECRRFGKLLADQVKEYLNNPAELTDYSMKLYQTTFTVKSRETDPLDVAMEKLNKAKAAVEQAIKEGVSDQQLRVIQSFYEGAQNNLLASSSLGNMTEIEVPVSALLLPNLTILFTPCELFSKLSNPYKKDGFEFVGYTNGYHLYMADAEAYDKQFYEASSSPYAKHAGESLIQQLTDWAKKLS